MSRVPNPRLHAPDCRAALETQSARLFAERATRAQKTELRRLARSLDALFAHMATRGNDAAFRFRVHGRHVQFHMRIAQHAGSRLLKDMIDRNHVLILNWLFDIAGRRTPLPPRFHSQLAEMLVSGDADKADTAMRAHVSYGFREISGQIGALSASHWRERTVIRKRN